MSDIADQLEGFRIMQFLRTRYLLSAMLPASVLLAACGGGGGGGDNDSDSNSGGGGGGGTPQTSLAQRVDDFMSPYLANNGITATTLTIMKDGAVLYEKAYGHKDAAATTPLTVDALMTGASIVKPVTAAAIQKLAAEGKLALADKVFCSGSTAPSTESHCWVSGAWVTSPDARIRDITIANLLAHQGGWDRRGTACAAYQQSSADIQAALAANDNPCDPVQHEFIVQAASGLASPPTLEQDIRFFMQAGLDYTPGTNPSAGADRYSNFGYMLLGLIIERSSGVDFNSYVNSQILAPLGIASTDFKTTNSLLANADPREPNYITTKTLPSVYVPGTVVSVRDGALNAVNHVAASTSMMTSKAMARFAGAFRIDTDVDGVDGVDNGKPLAGATHGGFHFGDLPGTSAVMSQRTSGVSYTVLMNKNDKFEGEGARKDYPSEVKVGIDAALAAAGY